MGMNILLLIFLFIKMSACRNDNKYCNLSATHALCKTSRVGAACERNYKQKIPDKRDINAILDWHNKYRQRVASGQETLSLGTLPSAKNMMKLQWDKELALIAQKHAEQCKNEHNCIECRSVLDGRFRVGQNIGLASYRGSKTPQFINWEYNMKKFYDGEVQIFQKSYVDRFVSLSPKTHLELSLFLLAPLSTRRLLRHRQSQQSLTSVGRLADLPIGPKVRMRENITRTGAWAHFSQVIWANTTHVGCGAMIYKTVDRANHLAICNYGAAGNVVDEKVYESGTPCSNCPSGTQCDSIYKALCA